MGKPKGKLETILSRIEGRHVLGSDGLRDYHAARRIRDAQRYKDTVKALRLTRSELGSYSGVTAEIVRIEDDLPWFAVALVGGNNSGDGPLVISPDRKL